MKILKLILLTLTISLFACSSDDKEFDSTPDNDPLIGTWGNYKIVYSNGIIEEYNPVLKIQQFVAIGFIWAGGNNSEIIGTWEKLADGNYKLIISDESRVVSISFSNLHSFGYEEMIINDSGDMHYYEKIN